MPDQIFISHSTRDDEVVKALGRGLEDHGVAAWLDSREIAAGDSLATETKQAIETARHVLAILSPHAVSSRWVQGEVRQALKVAKERQDGYKVIPILIEPIDEGILPLFFEDEPAALRYAVRPGAVSEILPDLLAALGHAAPSGGGSEDAAPVLKPVADLILELEDLGLDTSDGKHRATATAKLVYEPPASAGERRIKSPRFRFTAPLGPIETDEIRWYLERYQRWPQGVFKERAEKVESQLELWGSQLAEPLLGELVREAFEAWRRTPDDFERRFSILVDDQPIAGSDEATAQAASEGASLLLGLPWELLHDGTGYLFQGARGVQVRRQLSHRERVEPLRHSAPIRVLLVSPRPDDPPELFIDHRVSARPLVEALDSLGELAELDIITPPTLKALGEALRAGREKGRPYHVVHFDGHGTYDRKRRRGGLCFERPEDAEKVRGRRSVTVMADEVAAVLQEHRVPLVFLEACQSAKAEDDPTASVAGQLLAGGVASVVAMSHSVLVETARRFVAVFYRDLMAGRRVGDAMLAGQRELAGDTYRSPAWEGDFHLQDWFVPVLFQEEADPRLIARVPAQRVKELEAKRRELALGALPETPDHTFVGRSTELLLAERLLELERYAVLLGEGGEGKTTLAAELARWLVATRRFHRAAFVSLEHQPDARAVLHALGDQLVANFASRAGQSDDAPWQLVERALLEQPAILVLDNLESVLPPPEGSPVVSTFEPEVLDALLTLARRLAAVGSTRLVFTSREALPEPFASNHVRIGRLECDQAIELVGKVLRWEEIMPQTEEEAPTEDDLRRLVEAVNCHARSLVLVAREVGASGVWRATERLWEIMAALEEKYPDDRERSLFASVELSLQRLPEETRKKLPRLAVFHGGGQLSAISKVLGLDIAQKEHEIISRQLIDVGLAEMLPYGHLRLHPALGPALDRELSGKEREEARQDWLEAMEQVTLCLYQQRTQDAQIAWTLTLLELPNLMAVLEALNASADAEHVVGIATKVEALLQLLGRGQALDWVVRIREEMAQNLPERSHSRHLAEAAAINRLFEAGLFAKAVEEAEKIVECGLAAGEAAFAEAAYDLAYSHWNLGRALQKAGKVEASLTPLNEARRRFQTIADQGKVSATNMVSQSLTELGNSLTRLGRFDEAARAYEASIALTEKLGDLRGNAIAKDQLGVIRFHQKKFETALAMHAEAREIFERLGEPGTVAIVWIRTGMTYNKARQFEAAEEAYQRALRINAKGGNRQIEAAALGNLGLLYDAMGRLEESVCFLKQATTIDVESGDLAREGSHRNNLAIRLTKLQRYGEARQESLRAIECGKPFGHAAQLWKLFNTLHDVERAVGNDAAAANARKRALEAYLAYRRTGGENHSSAGLALAVGQALEAGEMEKIARHVAELYKDPDQAAETLPFLDTLQAILAGSRDPALAENPEMHYEGAAEIILLLENLNEAGI